MKKYLPLILLLVGIIVVVGAFLFTKSRRNTGTDIADDETALLEVPPDKRPVVALTPTEDAHYLKLKIEKIQIDNAVTMEYELLYQTADGVTQGTSGIAEEIGNKNIFETELLLGSESAGKFRYDEGVENGTISLKFRNKDGKLLVKFESDFHLETNTDLLTSKDALFKFELEDETGDYFITMETIGYPEEPSADVENGPYGVFSSANRKVPGSVVLESGNVYHWNGKDWEELSENKSSDIGIFFGSSQ